MESLFTFIYLGLVSLVIADGSGVERVLALVHIVYRHGDRSPITAYPKDPYQVGAWPQGFGQLTEKGMLQQYQLGQCFQQKYEGFINKTYDRLQIHVRSTDVDRTLQSAYCNLAGLYYPPQAQQMWNKNITWTPIPVHTVPRPEDNLLNTDVECPQASKQLQEMLQSDYVKQMEIRNKKFYEFIIKNTGYKSINISNIWRVRDALICEKSHDLDMPKWVNDTVLKRLKEIQEVELQLKFNNGTMPRFRGGPLLSEVVNHMKEKVNGKLNKKAKMFIYSAHDTTVTAFTSAMHVFNDISPPYATAVIVELYWSSSQNYTVRIAYRNDTSSCNTYTLTIKGCEEDCPLDRFLQLVKNNIPTDWHAECYSQAWTFNQVLVISVSIAASLAVLGLIIPTVVCLCRRRRATQYTRHWDIQTTA